MFGDSCGELKYSFAALNPGAARSLHPGVVLAINLHVM
jgi:hypothetical protein